MEPGKFTGEIRERLIVDALQTYVELFTNTQISEATDPHWVEAFNFFQALDEKNRTNFFRFCAKSVLIPCQNFFPF